MDKKKVKSLCERIYDLAEELKYETYDTEIQHDADSIMNVADLIITYVEEIPDEPE